MANALRENFNNAVGRRNGPPSWRDNLGDDIKGSCPSLSYETRLWAFLALAGIGVALSLFSTVFLFLNRLTSFAIYYSLGSIVALLSSFFLVGPCRQFSIMFAKNRWIAAVIYLVAIGLTLALAFDIIDLGEENERLKYIAIIASILVQSLAAFWYGMTFIPYGRTVVKKLIAFTCCGSHTALD